MSIQNLRAEAAEQQLARCRAEIEHLRAAWDNTRDSLRITVAEIERLRAALMETRTELFGMCEDTENTYHAVSDLKDDMGAFARGRIAEAKSLRNAMGEVFHAALSGKEES